MKVTHDIVGKINSSQDGVIITMNSLVPCLTSGLGMTIRDDSRYWVITVSEE